MEDSKSRKGWMQGPIAAPGGVVVLHATINISRWYCLLPNKICKYNWAEATAQLDKLKDFVLSQRNAVTMLNRTPYTKEQWKNVGKEPIYLAYKHAMEAVNRNGTRRTSWRMRTPFSTRSRLCPQGQTLLFLS